jgi:DNA primase
LNAKISAIRLILLRLDTIDKILSYCIYYCNKIDRPLISKRSIQQVLDTARAEDIVEDYVSLKRRGSNLIGLCPFHDEKTPSFTVSPSKNIYKCFGCGKGGGPVQFLMEHDQMSFPEAVRVLAKRYNIELEEERREDQEAWEEQKRQEESYMIINEFASDFFKKQLFDTQDGKAIALSYFKERGFLESTIKDFDLGYAPDSGKVLTEKAEKAQYNSSYLKEIGLSSEKGYDFFRNRVMFPIHSVSGKVIAFAGRTMSTSKKQPKYINSPESIIYNKRRVLYAIHLAKSEIRKKDNCYIVEGYTDVISLHQNGVRNVVASSGTALTSEQVRLVKRHTDNITFLYDGDAAGVKAAMRGLDIVLQNDMNVMLVLLPESEDPDSYIRRVGTEAFEQYIAENAKDFIYFKMALLLEEAGNNPVKKAELIKDIIKSIANVREPIKRSLYIKECSQSLEIHEELLIREVNKIIREEIRQKRLEKEREERVALGEQAFRSAETPVEQARQYQPSPKLSRKTHVYQEKDLARIIVCAGDKLISTEDEEKIRVADFIYSNILDVIDHFDEAMYRKIIEEGFKVSESENHGQSGISNYFINHEDPMVREFAIDCNSSPYVFANWESKDVYLQTQKMPEENFYRDSLQSILRFKLKKISKVIEELKKRSENTLQDPKQTENILRAYQTLSEQRKHIANDLGTVVP